MARNNDNWIQTASGKQFWPLDPVVSDIDIYDVAHALAMKCRYTGHTREFYSVAQHSVLMSLIVPLEDALVGLLHDATEAYLPDVARPVKGELPGFKEIENRLHVAIAKRFSLPWPMPASIEQGDLILLATERRDLMAAPPIPWRSTANVEPLAATIVPWDCWRARHEFIKQYNRLAHGVEAA